MKIFAAIDGLLTLASSDKCNLLIASAASPHEVATKIRHAKDNNIRSDPASEPASALLSEFGVAVTSGTWDESAKTLTEASAFAKIAYHASNDMYLIVTGGTGANKGIYRVTARTDNTLVLSESLSIDGGDLIAGDIAGYAFVVLPYSSNSNLLSVLPSGGYIDAMDAGLLMHLQVSAS